MKCICMSRVDIAVIQCFALSLQSPFIVLCLLLSVETSSDLCREGIPSCPYMLHSMKFCRGTKDYRMLEYSYSSIREVPVGLFFV